MSVPGLAQAPARAATPAGAWRSTAALAVVLPTLLAFNLPPSATFLNQAAAFIGWGLFALCLAATPGLVAAQPGRGPFGALTAALAVLALAAAAAPLWAGLPWTLALSAIATLAATAIVAAAGATMTRSGLAAAAFEPLCVALLVAGLLGAAIGVVQVFFPQWTDGNFIASISGGRAAGNLRQPNHLSSLLLWSLVALAWLGERRRLSGAGAALAALLLLAGIVLTGSRTGMLGVLLLAAWGALDGSLSRRARIALLVAPLVFALLWALLGAWAHLSQHEFAGDTKLTQGDISSSRFGIWANTLTLIARHPWFGVGWGEFNFAWSLTPFPGRPVAFFDHTHNLPLQFAVELGLPLTLLVLALLGWALWRAHRAGVEAPDPDTRTTLRAAFMLVLPMAVHSQFEYPLWYAHFLLPTAFAFGLCLGGAPAPQRRAAAGGSHALRIAAALLVVGGCFALYDYQRVVVIYAPRDNSPPLAERIADGRRSWFFGHHADYAEVTTDDEIAEPRQAFARVTHYLLDTRLMTAWARALAAAGETDAARHVAQRLREFRSPGSVPFFEVCTLLADADDAASAAAPAPFQCLPPEREPGFAEFRAP